jgi:hypothetical protein
MKKINRFWSASLLFPSLLAAQPVRITLGIDKAPSLQHSLVDDGDEYKLTLGGKTDVLKQAFDHIPYPVQFFEARVPKSYCADITQCHTEGRAATVRERTIVGAEKTFPADVRYQLTYRPADRRYFLQINFIGSQGARSLELSYDEAAVSID